MVRPGHWPSIRTGREAQADAGPTGRPWVDGNGWIVQLARVLEPSREVWLDFAPPAQARGEAYLLAAAEAEAYGAHWILPPAAPDATRIVETLEYFADHPAWRDWTTVAALGVVSDFAGPNRFLATEFLNLAARRPLACRILTEPPAPGALRAIVVIEMGAVSDALRQKMTKFAEGGGLVIAPAGFFTAVSGEMRLGYHSFQTGRGEIVQPPSKWVDPYLVVNDAHFLVGREHDAFRIYNATSMNCHYAAPPDGKRAVAHLLNYSLRPGSHPVTLATARRYRSARLYTLESPKPAALAVESTRYGTEVGLPPFGAYAAIELES